MNLRKQWLWGVVVVFAVLYVGAGALLYRGWAQYRRADRELGSAMRQLERLYARDPFPSEANLAHEMEKTAEMERELASLGAALSEGQTPRIEQSPPRFIAQFWDTRKALMDEAAAIGVKVPDDFSFGFDRYMTGSLPAQPDVARLTQQLTIMRALVRNLYESRVQSVTAIGREEFEGGGLIGGSAEADAGARRRRPSDAAVGTLNIQEPNAGRVPAGEQYGRWRFVVEFTAKESAVLDVLDRLAKGRLFVAVSRIELAGEDVGAIMSATRRPKTRGAPGAGQPDAEEIPLASLPRDLRMVCGWEAPLRVKMELEVVQFPEAPATGAQPAEG